MTNFVHAMLQNTLQYNSNVFCAYCIDSAQAPVTMAFSEINGIFRVFITNISIDCILKCRRYIVTAHKKELEIYNFVYFTKFKHHRLGI